MENSNTMVPPPLPPENTSASATKVNISTEKLFGAIGLIFIFFSIIPLVGLLFWFAGYILLTIGMYQLSKRFNNPSLFNNFLIAVVLSILGWVIALVFGVIASLSVSSVSHTVSSADLGVTVAFMTLYFIFLVVAYFYNKVFTSLALITKHNLFKIASITMVAGVVTSIILVGFIIMFVGWLLLVIAFFTAPNEVEVRSSH